MYILPILTHLEVVALGGRSDISPDQHLNYASNLWARQRRSWAGNGSTGQAEERPGHTNFHRGGGTGDTGSYGN